MFFIVLVDYKAASDTCFSIASRTNYNEQPILSLLVKHFCQCWSYMYALQVSLLNTPLAQTLSLLARPRDLFSALGRVTAL